MRISGSLLNISSFWRNLSSDRDCSAFFRGDLKDPGFEYRVISSAGKQGILPDIFLCIAVELMSVFFGSFARRFLSYKQSNRNAGGQRAYRKHLEDRILALPEVDQGRVLPVQSIIQIK